MINQNLHPTGCCKDKIHDTGPVCMYDIMYRMAENFARRNFFSPVLKIT